TSYLWDFGDGGTSTDKNPTHSYAATGSYIVSLIVSGPGGTSEAAQTTINVGQAVLGCDFSGVTTPLLNQQSNYTAQLTGLGGRAIATQTWTLGDTVVDHDDRFNKIWDTP